MTLDAGAEALTEAAFRTGDYSVAEKLLGDALSTAPDAATEAAALHQLGWLMHWQAIDSIVDGQVRSSDPEAEESLFQRAVDIRRSLGDQAGLAASLFGVGLVRQVLKHDWRGAIELFRSALPLAEDLITRSELHRHIGFYYLVEEKDYDEALRHLRISLGLREEHGDPRWIPSGTLAVGQALLMAGRPAEAVPHLRVAVDQSRGAHLRQERIAQAEDWLSRAAAAT